MRMHHKGGEDAKEQFAIAAAEHFNENPLSITFAPKGIEEGEFYALRWGMDGDSVVVFTVDYDEVVNYCSYIDKEAAKLYKVGSEAAEAAVKAAQENKGE